MSGRNVVEPVREETDRQHRLWPWLWAGAFLLLPLALYLGPVVWRLARDQAALEATIRGLGWFGPLALVVINVLQIVVAPIPGYVVQAAAGYLFGPLWGGVWGALGLLLGSLLAMALARTFGRPLAERFVGADRLGRWEALTLSTSTPVWFILLAAPTGDLPYFLAGLSRVSYRKILALTLLIRVPTTFLVAAAGANMWYVRYVSGWQLAVGVIILGALLVVFVSYQQRLARWLDRRLNRHLQRRLAEEELS